MNPYKSARLELGLTQLSLARECSVTTQVIGNLEVGLYYKPPVSVDSVFNDKGYYLSDRYKVWVRNERGLNSLKLTQALNQPDDAYLNWDWVTFRTSITQSFRGFCRIIVFQPSMLREYELQGINRGALNIALKQTGVDRDHRTALLYRSANV